MSYTFIQRILAWLSKLCHGRCLLRGSSIVMCPPNCWDRVEPVVSTSDHSKQAEIFGISFSSACELVCGSTLFRTIRKHTRACSSSQTHYDIRPPQPTHSYSQQIDVTNKQLSITNSRSLQHRTEPKLRTILQPVGWGGQLQYVLDFRDYVLPGGIYSHPNGSKQITEGTTGTRQNRLIKHSLCTSEFGHQSRQPERVSESACPSVCLDCHRHPLSHTCRSLSIWDTCRVYFMIILLCLTLCLPLSSGSYTTERVCGENRTTIGECLYGELLVIVNATYGSGGRLCASPNGTKPCSPRWTRHVLTTICTGRDSCRIYPYLDLDGYNCHLRNGLLELNYTCLSGDHFIALDGRSKTVLNDTHLKSGYLTFESYTNAVNSSRIYELHLNLTHSFHVDLSPLAWFPAFAVCENFKITTFSPHGKTTLCGNKSRLNMQIMNSSVTSIVFNFSVNLKELFMPFLVSSCDLSDIPLSSYDDLVINVVEETLEVSCREGGYRRTTDDLTLCKNGAWAGNVSVCEEIVCPVLGTITLGQIDLQNGRNFGSVANYSCVTKYKLVGSGIRQCQSNGTWSGSPPRCERIICQPPSVQSPAWFSPNDTDDYDLGASVTVTCPLGTRLTGKEVLTCLANESWSHPVPACEIVDCGEPDNLNNSVQNYSVTTFGSEVIYTCQSSDEFQSEDRVTCSENGQWSATALTCPKILPVKSQSMCSDDVITIKCPYGEMIVVVNASYGSHDNNTCNATSAGATTCSSRWTTQVLTTRCTGKTSCSIRPSTDLQGSECQVSNAQLDFNFTCVSSDHFVTTENGTSVLSDSISWGCLLPSAKESDDEDAQPAPRAEVDLRKVNRSVYLDFAAVNSLPLVENCDSLDLTLKSPSGDKTFCKEEIKNLNVIFVESSVTTLDIRWTVPSGNDTRIVVPFLVTECELKVDILEGNNLLSVDIGKQRLETICPEGYYKPQKSVCVGGAWLGNDSSCLPVSCPSLGTIQNGQLQLTGKTFKSVARYTCLRKFELLGNRERICQHTGTWSGITPSCQRVFCPSPGAPQGGWFSPDISKNYEVDATVQFQCQNGANLIGQSMITCLRNGTWSAGAPSCQWVDCHSPSRHRYTTVKFTSTIYNSEAHYVCHANPDVTYVTRCAEDGRWTSTRTTCPSPTTTVTTTSTPLPFTTTPDFEENDDDDSQVIEDDFKLSLGSILGIIFGAVGFILILSIIACVLCSFTTKKWRRNQFSNNLSDIVADNQGTDIRDSSVTNVYIIQTNNLYHEMAAQGSVQQGRPLSTHSNHELSHPESNHKSNGRKLKPAEKPIRMTNGNSSKYKVQEIPHNISTQTDSVIIPHSRKPHANGRNVIHLTHNHSHLNRPLNGLNTNNAQPHSYHTTHL